MKSYKSGAEKRKQIKRRDEINNQQRDSLLKFISLTPNQDTSQPSTSTIEKNVPLLEHQDLEKDTGLKQNLESTSTTTGEFKINSEAGRLDFMENIALWPKVLTDKMIEFAIRSKPNNVGKMENLKDVYTDDSQTYYRGLHEGHFYRKIAEGKKEIRNWLVFSETSKCVYCYPCKLFSNSTSKMIEGYQNWRHLTDVLSAHEVSKDHITSMCKLYRRSSGLHRIDAKLVQQTLKEENYWRDVLRRIVSTIKLIASLGVGFRGHDESQSSSRKGNYLTCLEYLSEYDEFLKLHLETYRNRGQGNVNYLSHQICDEFIKLISDSVLLQIIEEIKTANFYSIIVDSTPDISHVDQLTFIFRYVLPAGDIKERFVGFLPIEKHDAAYLEEQVLSKLKDMQIDIKLCRGQSYDNAANMSGKYTGLQSRIKIHSPTAAYIPCSTHSLNLVGNLAAESCGSATRYFLFVQNLFTFFNASTHRWNILWKKLQDCPTKLTVKKISDTRWSARADAVLALKCGYNKIKEALTDISDSPNEKKLTVIEAQSLIKNMNKYETVLITIIWNKILQRINATSKSLQSAERTVLQGVSLLNSLESFIRQFRNEFETVEKEAENHTSSKFEERRTKKRKKNFDEMSDNDHVFSEKEDFICNTFYIICDQLIAEFIRRKKAYEDILQNFKIFFNISMPDNEKKECINNLKEIYEKDINICHFESEVEQFLFFIKEEKEEYSAIDAYKVASDLIETFPNVEIILRIFLTLPISNASAERSFSSLKRIKNYVRNKMQEDRLNSMTLLYIEYELLNKINCDHIIDKFAKEKSRRKYI